MPHGVAPRWPKRRGPLVAAIAPLSLADTFDYLRGLPEDGRRRCLTAALQEDHAGVQRMALQQLLAPGDTRCPELVVDHFSSLRPEVHADLVPHHAELLAIARARIVGDAPCRPAAFRFVAAAGDPGCADLLALGIEDADRAIADVALAALAAHCRAATGARAPWHEAVWQAMAEAARRCPDRRAQALAAVLFDLGVAALPIVGPLLVAAPEPALGRAFGSLLAAGAGRIAARLALHLATGPDLALQRVGKQVLRQRRDEEFALGLASAAAEAGDATRTALGNLRELPWWDAVQAVVPRLAPEVARSLVTLLGQAAADPFDRQGCLEPFLAHPDGDVQAAAVAQLHELRCPAGLAKITQLIRGGAPAGQRAAMRLVEDLAPHDRLAMWTLVLGSSDAALREQAVAEVSQVSFARYLERFEGMDKTARPIAARALAKIDHQMLDRLAAEIGALDPVRRLKALQIVDMLAAGQELHDTLLELLDDPDRRVRATAIRVVELTGSLEGMKVLLGALADDDSRVRANAIEAFEELADPRFVQLLTPFLRDRDNRVRANAAKALWHLGWTEAREELLDMLEDDDEAMRISAIWAIGAIRFDGARTALAARERIEPVGRVRVKIREALAAMPEAEVGR